MSQKRSDYSKPTSVVQVASFITLSFLVWVDANSPEFEVPLIVYGIIGGVLFGVSNIKRFVKGILK